LQPRQKNVVLVVDDKRRESGLRAGGAALKADAALACGVIWERG